MCDKDSVKLSILRTAIHTAVEALHHGDYGDVEDYLWSIDREVADLEDELAEHECAPDELHCTLDDK